MGMIERLPQKPIRILYLEDEERDRELFQMALMAGRLNADLTYPTSRTEFEAALAGNRYDLIVSDFTLPAYDGMTALATAQSIQEQTPFIFLSGAIGEECAIECLRNGATDYVLKDRIERL